MAILEARKPRQLTAESFARDGFGIVEGALDPDLLDLLRRSTESRLDAERRDHFEAFPFHGSMLVLDPFGDDSARALVSNPRLRATMAELGFSAPKWLSAYLISKPPGSPSLWWHQDWWAWDEEVSHAPWPAQIFVMYYLRDVAEEDGALRVIPGSHRCRHRLHDVLPPAHSEEINRASAQGPAHAHQPGEETVAVRAGDAVIGDSRLLHCTHPNRSDQRRTCLTVWYLPRYLDLPDPIRSYVVEHPALPPRGWWSDKSFEPPAPLRELLPTYAGSAAPAAHNRTPPADWPLASPA